METVVRAPRHNCVIKWFQQIEETKNVNVLNQCFLDRILCKLHSLKYIPFKKSFFLVFNTLCILFGIWSPSFMDAARSIRSCETEIRIHFRWNRPLFPWSSFYRPLGNLCFRSCLLYALLLFQFIFYSLFE